MRIGLGYDVHKYTAGRPLRLGGVSISHPYGLEGHSDGDALLHAICDALLGAANLGDIGQLFPPTDPTYKNIDSRLLLREVAQRIYALGWEVCNIDAVILAQTPKLSPYYNAMREAIAAELGLSPEQVSIKATTPERLGALGREEGLAAYAVALLERPNRHEASTSAS